MDEKPENVMEFNRIRDLFESMVKSKLADSKACFKINLAVDTIWYVDGGHWLSTHAGFGNFLPYVTSSSLHKLIYSAPVWATPSPPKAACVVNKKSSCSNSHLSHCILGGFRLCWSVLKFCFKGHIKYVSRRRVHRMSRTDILPLT